MKKSDISTNRCLHVPQNVPVLQGILGRVFLRRVITNKKSDTRSCAKCYKTLLAPISFRNGWPIVPLFIIGAILSLVCFVTVEEWLIAGKTGPYMGIILVILFFLLSSITCERIVTALFFSFGTWQATDYNEEIQTNLEKIAQARKKDRYRAFYVGFLIGYFVFLEYSIGYIAAASCILFLLSAWIRRKKCKVLVLLGLASFLVAFMFSRITCLPFLAGQVIATLLFDAIYFCGVRNSRVA